MSGVILRSLVALALALPVACGAPASPPGAPAPVLGEEIRIGDKRISAGEVRLRRSEAHFEADAKRPDGSLSRVVTREVQEVREEHLADGNLRVTWVDKVRSVHSEGVPTDTPPSALVGRTLIVTSVGGKIVFLDEAGQPCFDPACEEAREDYKPLKSAASAGGGKSARSLHDPIRVGERVDDLAPQLVGAFPEDMRASELMASLDAVEGDGKARAAVFGIKGKIEMTVGGALQIEFTGRTRRRIADGRYLGTEIEGPLVLTMKTPQGPVKAVGTFRLRETLRWF